MRIVRRVRGVMMNECGLIPPRCSCYAVRTNRPCRRDALASTAAFCRRFQAAAFADIVVGAWTLIFVIVPDLDVVWTLFQHSHQLTLVRVRALACTVVRSGAAAGFRDRRITVWSTGLRWVRRTARAVWMTGRMEISRGPPRLRRFYARWVDTTYMAIDQGDPLLSRGGRLETCRVALCLVYSGIRCLDPALSSLRTGLTEM